MKIISPNKLNKNFFEEISKNWMLVLSGSIGDFNSMTASWGGIGHIWNMNISIIYIRPQRYTYNYVEENLYYSLCFFDEKYKNLLNYFGTNSGRNVDKMNIPELTVSKDESGAIYYNEAKLIIICKKLYSDFIKSENFLLKDIEKFYPDNDYHKFYYGEIINCMIRED